MKHFLLVTIVAFSICAYAQNPPVAVDDSAYVQNIYIANQDTVSISPHDLIQNDTSANGGFLRVQSIIYSGSNYVNATIQNGNVSSIEYFTGANFAMRDTFQYVLYETGNSTLTDTATAVIIVMRKSHEVLDANNIHATIDKYVLFSGAGYSKPGFEVPKNSGSHSIYASNMWVIGQESGNIYGNVRKFGGQTSSGNDMFSSNSGPVSNISHTDSLMNTKWDRVWKVKQYEIDYHTANWNSINYTAPISILDWPAHGDTTLGEAYYLAPFVDVNNDGNYTPLQGDYPQIKGDQAIYFIYNDGFSNFLVNPMKAEIQGMAYAYQCQDSALQNTIFVDYKIINRSQKTYINTKFGMWADMDLGNGNDDYVQSDVDRNLFYTFNGDAFDEDAGRPGYRDNPPGQALMMLKGVKQDNDGQDNAFGIGANQSINGTGFGDGIADNELWGMTSFRNFYNGGTFFGDPRYPADYLNYFNAYWKDSTPLVYGGMGHQSSPLATTQQCNFAFPDSSDSYNYGTIGVQMPAWNQISANLTPADVRGILISGPVTFAPGDEIELTYAFVFGRDYVNMGAQAGVTNMLERADSIRSYYNQGLTACGFPVSVKEPIDTKSNLLIYPNPTNNLINIRQEKANSITIQVLDITGKVLLTKSSINQLTTIDLREFTNGIYLVKVISGNNIIVQKIIKN